MPDRGRRRFLQGGLALVGASLLAGCSRLADRRQSKALPRVGFLGVAPQPFHEEFFAAFRELGYVEGENVVVERRYPGERIDRLPELAAELASMSLDVIVTAGTIPTMKRFTDTVPIIGMQNDFVESGYAVSLARPGGNITGINLSNAALATKRLELLKEAFPGISRVAVLTRVPNTDTQTNGIEPVAGTLGITLQRYDVPTQDDFDAAFAAIKRDRAEAISVLDQPLLTSFRAQIIAFAAQERLPAIYPQRVHAADGGLMAYGPSYADMFRRLAVFTDKILRGASPAEIPIEQPATFDFPINLKAAEAAGFALSQSMLQQATELIQ